MMMFFIQVCNSIAKWECPWAFQKDWKSVVQRIIESRVTKVMVTLILKYIKFETSL